MKKFILSVLLVCLISCKENKSKTIDNIKIDSGLITKPKPEENFKVKLKGVFNKDDKFALFYIENEAEKYNATKLVTVKFVASSEIQEIILEAPSKVYPMNFRLDFGANKEQSAIKIYECILIYKKESYTIKGSELKKYFYFNDGIKIQPDSLTFNLSTFKLHGKEVYNPYIAGKKSLTEILDFKL